MSFWRNTRKTDPLLAVLNHALFPDLHFMMDSGEKEGLGRIGYCIPAEYVRQNRAIIREALNTQGIENIDLYSSGDVHLSGSDAKLLAQAGVSFLGSTRLSKVRLLAHEIQALRQDLMLFAIPSEPPMTMPYQGKELHAFATAEQNTLPVLRFINNELAPSLDAKGMDGGRIGLGNYPDAELLQNSFKKHIRAWGTRRACPSSDFA